MKRKIVDEMAVLCQHLHQVESNVKQPQNDHTLKLHVKVSSDTNHHSEFGEFSASQINPGVHSTYELIMQFGVIISEIL